MTKLTERVAFELIAGREGSAMQQTSGPRIPEDFDLDLMRAFERAGITGRFKILVQPYSAKPAGRSAFSSEGTDG